MNLKNLAQLNSVYKINQKPHQTAGSSNNFLKWLFSSDTETESIRETVSEPILSDAPVAPVSIVPTPSPEQNLVLAEPVTEQEKKKHLMIIFVGLPKCGKTQLSIDILNKLKTLNLKSKYVETPVNADDFTTRKYYDNIKSLITKNMDVIICNGNNFDEKIRKNVIKISQTSGFDILFVDFKHSDDADGTFDNYKMFCNKAIQARTDTVALNTDLNKAIENYKQLTQEELEGNNYIKIYVNNNKLKNTNDIILKIKSIFGM